MPSSPASKTSTGFVSLQDYLDQNAPGVANVTNDVVGGATNAADAARAGADTFSGQVEHSSAATGKPVDPSALADYGSALSSAQAAQQRLGALGSYGGISDALQQQYGGTGSGYSTGDRNLDASLLTAGSRGAISAAQGKYGNLTDYLNSNANAAAAKGAGEYTPPIPGGEAGGDPIGIKDQPGSGVPRRPIDPDPSNPGSAKNNPNPRGSGDDPNSRQGQNTNTGQDDGNGVFNAFGGMVFGHGSPTGYYDSSGNPAPAPTANTPRRSRGSL